MELFRSDPGLLYGVYEVIDRFVGSVAVGSQAEVHVGEIGSLDDARAVDLGRIVNRFLVLGSAPIDHVVRTDRQMEFPVVVPVDVALYDRVVPVEDRQFAVDVVAEIVGSARPAREDFENAGERGVLRHLFRDPGADFRGYQIVGRSGAVVVVVVGAGYGGEQKCESP